MKPVHYTGLPPPPLIEERAVVIRIRVASALAIALALFAGCALAQEPVDAERDDLDVTMQIIVDPDAKVPEEVIRRIPLPARQRGSQPVQAPGNESATPDAANKGLDRAQEARELGRGVAESARERAQEAAEQREQARRSIGEERRRERGPPADPPGRPERPPRP